MGDEKDPSHVIVEAKDSILWKAVNGLIEGVTLRRPRITTENGGQVRDVLQVEPSCSIHMAHCTLKGSASSQRQLIDKGGKMFGGISIAPNGVLSMLDVSPSISYFSLKRYY